MKGSGHGFHFPGGIEENHKKPQDDLRPSRSLNQAPPEHDPRATPNHSSAHF